MHSHDYLLDHPPTRPTLPTKSRKCSGNLESFCTFSLCCACSLVHPPNDEIGSSCNCHNNYQPLSGSNPRFWVRHKICAQLEISLAEIKKALLQIKPTSPFCIDGNLRFVNFLPIFFFVVSQIIYPFGDKQIPFPWAMLKKIQIIGLAEGLS